MGRAAEAQALSWHSLTDRMDIARIRAARYSPPRSPRAIEFGATGVSSAGEQGWRTLAAISTECDLQPGEYTVGRCRVRVALAQFALPVSQPGDKRAVEVLVRMSEIGDILAAHTYAEGILLEFLDRVALCGYAATRLERLISTCPKVVLLGEDFEMITPDYPYHRTRVPIGPADISRFDAFLASDEAKFACSRVRKALEAQTLEERLLNNYIALERIADAETSDTILHKCKECGAESDTGRKATVRYIRQLLHEDGVEKKSADEVISARGQLAHGAGSRNEAFLLNLCRFVSVVESTAVGVTAERSGALVRHSDHMIPVLPVARYTCKRHLDGTFSILGFKRNANFSAARVKRARDPVPGAGVFIGMVTDESGALPIDPDAWPD